MKIQYSPQPLPEIEISGSRESLLSLANSISVDFSQVNGEISENPYPFERFLHAIIIRHEDNKRVRFSVEETNLIVAGDLKNLEKLAEAVFNLTSEKISFDYNYHIHVENGGEDHFVDDRSIPVVIELECAKNV